MQQSKQWRARHPNQWVYLGRGKYQGKYVAVRPFRRPDPRAELKAWLLWLAFVAVAAASVLGG